jgi:hypothetical protein
MRYPLKGLLAHVQLCSMAVFLDRRTGCASPSQQCLICSELRLGNMLQSTC